MYTLLYTLGFNSVFHLYNFVITDELLGVIWIPLAFSNRSTREGCKGIMHLLEEGFNFHTYGAAIGFLSIAWGGHFLHLYSSKEYRLKGLLGFHGGLKSNIIQFTDLQRGTWQNILISRI